GLGELSFLGLTHYYGQLSLAAWGSGTGGAGLVGAGLYVLLTDWIGLGVRDSLLISALLPAVMLLAFFVVLPGGPLFRGPLPKEYAAVPESDPEDEGGPDDLPAAAGASSGLLGTGTGEAVSTAHTERHESPSTDFATNLRRARRLFVPYMVP